MNVALKGFLIFVVFIVLILAFESGQSKVDNWESKTGNYGQGLR